MLYRNLFKSTVFALSALSLVACSTTRGPIRSYVNTADMPQRTMSIAVMPLENYTTYKNAGMIMTHLLSTELMKQNLFRIMEDTELRKWLTQKEINPSHLEETTYARQVAQKLNVEAVLVGSVTEYGYQHGLKEEPTVGVNVKLVKASDGSVIWSSSHSEVGHGIFFPDSLNATAQRVLMRIIGALNRQMACTDQKVR